MTDHRHKWAPVPGWRAQYRCACGATGYRPYFGGQVKLHRRPHLYPASWTVRPLTEFGGRVAARIAEDFGGLRGPE